MPTDNSDFGSIIGVLVKPLYILQMARSKQRWSPEARLKTLRRMRTALQQAIEECDALIENERRRIG